MGESKNSNLGKVYLVGAGPGDAGLITLRGIHCLQQADVVLYDYLVNPQIVEHAPADAEKVCLGQHGRTRIWTQDEINQRLVQAARAGLTVVRLKGGDPAVFSRSADETEYLAQHHVPMETVPGITASFAASSFAGIPFTHRDFASAVALITGQEQSDKEQSQLDYEALAHFPGTLVVYMGVTTARKWSAALMQAGKPAETPVAIIRRCSLPDQETVTCTLGEVAERLTPHSKFPPPVIVIIGEVVRVRETNCWFEKRPLFGTSILVTRPVEQMSALCSSLSALGADVMRQPTIAIREPDDWAPVDSTLGRLDQFDWLVFSSANGVRYFLDRLATVGRDLRALAAVQLGVVGPGTAEELSRYRLRADLQPAEFRAEPLAAALAVDAKDRRFLLVRASRGREVLAQQLAQAGGDVEQVVAYQSIDITTADDLVRERLSAGKIDWVTVTSSAIARSLVGMFGEQLRQSQLVSISPVTSETMRELGYEPAAEASQYTMSGVVEAIVRSVAKS